MRSLRWASLILAAAPLAACVQLPKAVDVGPVPDYFRRDEVPVMWEICIPDQTIPLERIDIDAGGYVRHLADERRAHPDRADIAAIEAPATSASGHVTIRHLKRDAPPGGFATTRLWPTVIENDDGARSIGGGWMDLETVTATAQPVYSTLGTLYRGLVAIGVEGPGAGGDEDMRYWFLPPPAEQVPFGAFTAWQSPVSREPKNHLQYGGVVYQRGPKAARGTPIDGDRTHLPKIRYRLLASQQDYWERDPSWRAFRDALPRLLTEQHGIKAPPYRDWFFPDTDASAPRCD